LDSDVLLQAIAPGCYGDVSSKGNDLRSSPGDVGVCQMICLIDILDSCLNFSQ